METYNFGESFQRKILALAIRGVMLQQYPDIFQSRFFGSADGSRSLRPPRQRIAELVEHFAKHYRNERPGVATMDELVRTHAHRMKPAERQVFEGEWQAIRTIEVPDPTYVLDQSRKWAQEVSMNAAITQAAFMIGQSRENGKSVDGSKIRRMVEEALHVGSGVLHGGPLLEGAEAWLLEWLHAPEALISPTGFPKLDRAMDGGPRRGETMYVLAPPKGAKTAMLLNIALNAMRHRRGVVYCSFEMGLQPMRIRMGRNIARLSKQELRRDASSFKVAIKALRSFGVYDMWIQRFHAQRHGCEEVTRVIEQRRAMGYEVDVVVMDYLNTMASSQREREKRHQLTAISRDMSTLAHEMGVTVWTAALVKRTAVNKETVRKTDIGEAFEVISVLDGAVAVCGSDSMWKEHRHRNLYLTALRENEEEKFAGLYFVDLDRMVFKEVHQEGVNG